MVNLVDISGHCGLYVGAVEANILETMWCAPSRADIFSRQYRTDDHIQRTHRRSGAQVVQVCVILSYKHCKVFLGDYY